MNMESSLLSFENDLAQRYSAGGVKVTSFDGTNQVFGRQVVGLYHDPTSSGSTAGPAVVLMTIIGC